MNNSVRRAALLADARRARIASQINLRTCSARALRRGVAQQVIFQANPPHAFRHGGEQHVQHFGKPLGLQGVKIVLCLRGAVR